MKYRMRFPCPRCLGDHCTAEAVLTDEHPGPPRVAALPGACPTTGVPFSLTEVTEALTTVRAIVDEYEADASSVLAPPCNGGPLCHCLH